jgi:arylsulfatase B/arylsulfatase I/J
MPQVEEYPLLLPLSSAGSAADASAPEPSDDRPSYLSTFGNRVGSVAAVALLITGTLEMIAMGRTSAKPSVDSATDLQTAPTSLAAVATPAEISSSKDAAELPHMVFVLLDDAGWNDFGYQSVDLKFASPNIDQLSKNGVRLHNYYTQPSCTPSRASLMTGKYPTTLGMQHECIQPGSAWGLPLEHATLANELKSYGYHTAAVGKWDLGHYVKEMWPTERGFDSWLGLSCRGISNYFTYDNGGYSDIHRDLAPAPEMMDIYSTEAFRQEALRVIEDHAQDHASEPLFLYVAFNAIHDLLMVPTGFRHTEVFEKITTNVTFDNRKLAGGALYVADSAIGDIVQSLKDKGMYDNSILVVVSDNGGSPADGGNNWPLRGAKKDFYQGGVRVPGFVHSPLITAAGGSVGRYYKSPVHVSDWFPTFVKGVLGQDVSSELDGVDQWDALVFGVKDEDIANAPRDEVLHNIDYLSSEDAYLDYDKTIGAITANVRGTMYKMILNDRGDSLGTWYEPYSNSNVVLEGGLLVGADTGRGEAQLLRNVTYVNETKFLFDLQNDPYELINLWDHSPFQKVKNEVITKLCSHWPKMASTVYVPRVSGSNKKAMVTRYVDNDNYITWWNLTSKFERSQFPLSDFVKHGTSEGEQFSCPFEAELADLFAPELGSIQQV